MMAPMRIVAVVFPDVQSLDVTGPTEVFSIAQRLWKVIEAPAWTS